MYVGETLINKFLLEDSNFIKNRTERQGLVGTFSRLKLHNRHDDNSNDGYAKQQKPDSLRDFRVNDFYDVSK